MLQANYVRAVYAQYIVDGRKVMCLKYQKIYEIMTANMGMYTDSSPLS